MITDRRSLTPYTQRLLELTDEDNTEFEGNITLTVPERLVEYYLEAAGIEHDSCRGFLRGGERIAWEKDEALMVALAIVATYR